MNQRLFLNLLFFAVLLLGIGFVVRDSLRFSVAPTFKMAARPVIASFEGVRAAEQAFITPGIKPYVHAVSLVRLNNGNILAVWYAGDREHGQKVALYTAQSRAGDVHHWSTPVPVCVKGLQQSFPISLPISFWSWRLYRISYNSK